MAHWWLCRPTLVCRTHMVAYKMRNKNTWRCSRKTPRLTRTSHLTILCHLHSYHKILTWHMHFQLSHGPPNLRTWALFPLLFPISPLSSYFILSTACFCTVQEKGIAIVTGFVATAHCSISWMSSSLPPVIAVVFLARLRHTFSWVFRFIWLHIICVINLVPMMLHKSWVF